MSVLEQVEIFSGLTEEELSVLTNVAVTRNYPKNTIIINENDFADSLYVIESGKVKVYCSDTTHKRLYNHSILYMDI